MTPIHILGIAPYESLKNMMVKLASSRKDIHLTSFVGDLETGVDFVSKHLGDFDVIVSRGGTAEMIAKSTSLPVIDIRLSVYDVFRAIRLADNYRHKYAIVGFPAITSTAHTLCDLFQYQLNIYTIHGESEALQLLQTLQEEGYNMILCDMITNTLAKRLGMNSILITSGAEAIQDAFDTAVSLCRSYSSLRQDLRLLSSILASQNTSVLVLNSHGEIVLNHLQPAEQEAVLNYLRKKNQEFLSSEKKSCFYSNDSGTWAVKSTRIEIQNVFYVIYEIEYAYSYKAGTSHGITYYTREQAMAQYADSHIDSIAEYLNKIRDRAGSSPLLITGEDGTGTDIAAFFLYSTHSENNTPLILISCDPYGDTDWNFLFHGDHSPFWENGNTIFLQDIHHMDSRLHREFLTLARETNLCQRNRLLLSYTQSGKNNSNIWTDTLNQLSGVPLLLPALRDCMSDITSISSLFINRLNQNSIHPIIGFEPAAIDLLESYDWPGNHSQLKRIIQELCMIAEKSYITAAEVSTILSRETSFYNPKTDASYSSSHPLERIVLRSDCSLHEMNQSIIRHVMKQNKNNQSSTAKQLGISRTTLWRYLNH